VVLGVEDELMSAVSLMNQGVDWRNLLGYLGFFGGVVD